MSTRISELLSARVLFAIAGLTGALFVLSGIIATAAGREPESAILDALGTIGWFGFLIGLVVLLAASVVSLAAHAVARNRPGGAA